MIVKKFTWDLDPYGSEPANLITDELQSVTAGNGGDFFFFIPKGAPYFAKDAKLVHVATGKELVEGVDWEPSYLFELVSKRTYMPVYGGVSILDTSLTGVFKFTYQTLGGEYTIDTASIIELLSNAITDPRTTTWEKITNVPWYFTPIAHRFDVNDTVGAKDLADKIEGVADAIRESADNFYPALNEHLADVENPHQVSKAQVGLSEISNFPMATQEEADIGTRLDRYVSVGLVRRMISLFGGGGGSSTAHVTDTNNPHQVTKAQVGLGSVDNFPTATQAEAEAGTAADRFMTPLRVAQAITKLIGDSIGGHLTNKDNPHEVTKSQIGLSNVDNYSTADDATATNKLNDSTFLTPKKAWIAVKDWVADAFAAHVSATDNPHWVTKAQVGLENVDNFATASQEEAEAGTAPDRFMTAVRVAQAIAKGNTSFTDHANNTDNPHSVTKAQVGLGNVDNFSTATTEQALAENPANDLFMTPTTTAAMVQKLASSGIDAHVADKSNPHEVTKAQIGLGDVENYAMATQTEAEAGTSELLYMSPFRVAQAIAKLVGNAFYTHAEDKSNPHEVTKAQVGLGNVDDYATATVDQTKAGTNTDLFVTPAGLAATISDKVATEAEAEAGIANDKFVTPAGVQAALLSLFDQTPVYTDTTLDKYANVRVMDAGVDLTIPTAGIGAVGGGLIRVTIDHVVSGGVNIACTNSQIINPNYSANSVTLNTVGKEFVLAAVQYQGSWAWRISSIS